MGTSVRPGVDPLDSAWDSAQAKPAKQTAVDPLDSAWSAAQPATAPTAAPPVELPATARAAFAIRPFAFPAASKPVPAPMAATAPHPAKNPEPAESENNGMRLGPVPAQRPDAALVSRQPVGKTSLKAPPVLTAPPATSASDIGADPREIYYKAGHPVVDTDTKDAAGHVPTHRVDQPTNRQPGETWQQYEARVLAKTSFSPDTAREQRLDALEPDVHAQADSLLAAANRDGVKLTPRETRRTQERQEMLFQKGRGSDKGQPSTWTLTSDHTPGRAIDFDGDPAALAWLQQNAPKHGFSVMGDMDLGHVAIPAPTPAAARRLGQIPAQRPDASVTPATAPANPNAHQLTGTAKVASDAFAAGAGILEHPVQLATLMSMGVPGVFEALSAPAAWAGGKKIGQVIEQAVSPAEYQQWLANGGKEVSDKEAVDAAAQLGALALHAPLQRGTNMALQAARVPQAIGSRGASVLGHAITGAATGAALTPDDRTSGAILGAGIGGTMGAASGDRLPAVRPRTGPLEPDANLGGHPDRLLTGPDGARAPEPESTTRTATATVKTTEPVSTEPDYTVSDPLDEAWTKAQKPEATATPPATTPKAPTPTRSEQALAEKDIRTRAQVLGHDPDEAVQLYRDELTGEAPKKVVPPVPPGLTRSAPGPTPDAARAATVAGGKTGAEEPDWRSLSEQEKKDAIGADLAIGASRPREAVHRETEQRLLQYLSEPGLTTEQRGVHERHLASVRKQLYPDREIGPDGGFAPAAVQSNRPSSEPAKPAVSQVDAAAATPAPTPARSAREVFAAVDAADDRIRKLPEGPAKDAAREERAKLQVELHDVTTAEFKKDMGAAAAKKQGVQAQQDAPVVQEQDAATPTPRPNAPKKLRLGPDDAAVAPAVSPPTDLAAQLRAAQEENARLKAAQKTATVPHGTQLGRPAGRPLQGSDGATGRLASGGQAGRAGGGASVPDSRRLVSPRTDLASGDAEAVAPTRSVRDADGKLRRNLGKVPTKDLAQEWARLSEMNQQEEQLHAGIKESGYRANYEELPSSERLGRRAVGKDGRKLKRRAEDLPDADGEMDSDVLEQHNQVIRDFNRNQIVRAAREKAAARIHAEIVRRGEDPFDHLAQALERQHDGPVLNDDGDLVNHDGKVLFEKKRGYDVTQRGMFGDDPTAVQQDSLFGGREGTDAARSMEQTDRAARAELEQLRAKVKIASPAHRAQFAERIAALEKLVNRDRAITAGEMARRAAVGEPPVDERGQSSLFEKGKGYTVAPARDPADFAGLYSRLGRAIDNAPFRKGTAEQWAAAISKNVAKGEREWTGIDRFLAESAGKVLTQEQVAAHFEKNRIRLKESVSGDRGHALSVVNAANDAASAAYEARGQARMALDAAVGDGLGQSPAISIRNGMSNEATAKRLGFELTPGVSKAMDAYRAAETEHTRAWQEAQRVGRRENETAPKFAQYTEPGGENYREIKIQLEGNRPGPARAAFADFRERMQAKYLAGGQWAQKLSAAEEVERESLARAAAHETDRSFQSSHFDEPNILAHARVNERTLPNGEKVLFVEEIQSDWHQQGKSDGYADPKRRFVAHDDGGIIGYYATSEEAAAATEGRYGGRVGLAPNGKAGVPDAPFKKTEEWLGLTMKRLIDEAVSTGADRIAWTTGDQQAARYDLSKQVDRITYDPATGKLSAIQDGEVVHGGTYDRKALPSVIGKEAAAKLLAATPAPHRQWFEVRWEGEDAPIEPAEVFPVKEEAEHSARMWLEQTGDRAIVAPVNGHNVQTIQGDDLKVGGSGMRAFYDEMIPSWVRDYAKKMGVKLDIDTVDATGEDVPRATEDAYGNLADAPPLREASENQSFRITPELRAKVQGEGQFLLERGAHYAPLAQTELFQQAIAHPNGTVAQSLDRQESEIAFGSLHQRAATLDPLRPSIDAIAAAKLPTAADRLAAVQPHQRPPLSVDYRGTTIRSLDGLYHLGAIARHPGIEHFQLVMLKGNVVVGHRIETSGAINFVRVAALTNDAALLDLVDDARTAGADSVIMLHNHPSGSISPSREDIAVTQHFGAKLAAHGLRLVGHMVIDHYKASWLTPDADGKIETAEHEMTKPRGGHSLPDWESKERAIRGPGDIGALGTLATHPEGVVMLALDTEMRIVAVEPRTLADARRADQWLGGRLHDLSASGAVFLAGPGIAKEISANYTHALDAPLARGQRPYRIHDVIEVTPNADPTKLPSQRSLAEAGLHPIGAEREALSPRQRLRLRAPGRSDPGGVRGRSAPAGTGEVRAPHRVGPRAGDESALRTSGGQTDTPEFKRWFGKSKVVDADGKPAVVYHGTDAEFDAFDRGKSRAGPSKFGFWFTPDQGFAEMFGSNTMPLFLRMERPYTISSSRWDAIRERHAKDDAWFEAWRNELIEKGHDGLVVKGEKFTSSRGLAMDDPSVMAVFDPRQVKSATGNSGAFDPSNPSILREDSPGYTTGVSNAENAKIRERFGMDERETPETRSFDEMYDAGKTLAASDPRAIDRLLDQLRADPEKMVSTAGEAGLILKHRLDLENELSVLNSDIDEANKNGLTGKATLLGVQLEKKIADIKEVAELQERAGTALGRALVFRKAMSAMDYSLSTMLTDAHAAVGRKPTDAEYQEIKALHAKMQADLAAIEKDKAAALERAAEAEADLHHARLRLEARGPLPERFAKATARAADEAAARLRAKGLRAMSGIDPQDLADIAIIGVDELSRGAQTFAEWSASMVSRLGDYVRPHLHDIFDRSNAEFNDAISRAEETARKGKPKGKPKGPEKRAKSAPPTLRGKIQARLEDGAGLGDLQPYLRKLALEHINDGITTREGVLDELHREMTLAGLDVTREEVRDALSGYGKFSPLDKAPDKTRLREIQAESQKLAQLEALLRKEAPLATGFERGAPSDETRQLTKKVNEAKKAAGIGIMDDAGRLKSALASAKTRVRNQITDLQTEIDLGERLVSGKRTPISDPELEALKAHLALLRKTEEEVFGDGVEEIHPLRNPKKKPVEHDLAGIERSDDASDFMPSQSGEDVTESLKAQANRDVKKGAADQHPLDVERRRMEQQLRAVTKAAERNAAAWKDRLARAMSGDFAQPGSPRTYGSPQIEALRAQAKAAKAEFDELKGLDPAQNQLRSTAANNAYRANLARREAELLDRMAKGDFAPRPKKVGTVLDAESLKRRAAFEGSKREWDRQLKEWEKARRSPGQKIRDRLGAVPGTAKALKASLDNSALFRQGLRPLVTHPQTWARNSLQSWLDIARTFKGREVRDEVTADIASRPNAPLYRRAKLAVSTTEESFPQTIQERIPYLGRAFKAADVAFTAFQHRMRADIFDQYIDLARETGVDVEKKEELESIGKLVNALTGRAHLGRMEMAAGPVNDVFFSPRALKAHFDVLTVHATDPSFSRFARKQAAINLLKIVAAMASIMAIANAVSPGSAETDPRSSDFGRIKVGDTRFDFTGGMGSLAVLAGRLLSFSTKSSTTGARMRLNSGGQTGTDVLYSFFENKLSPVASVAKEVLKGKTFSGDRPTVAGEASNLLMPLPIANAMELFKSPNGANPLAGILADAVGVGTNTYGAPSEESIEKQMESGAITRAQGRKLLRDAAIRKDPAAAKALNEQKELKAKLRLGAPPK